MRPLPDRYDEIELDDSELRDAFIRRIIEKGAAEVQRERTTAFLQGLIDREGRVIRRTPAAPIDERLTVEQ